MHLCFVDESGTPVKPNGQGNRFFVFGGLLIPEERWSDVRSKLVGLKSIKKYWGQVIRPYIDPHSGWGTIISRASSRTSA